MYSKEALKRKHVGADKRSNGYHEKLLLLLLLPCIPVHVPRCGQLLRPGDDMGSLNTLTNQPFLSSCCGLVEAAIADNISVDVVGELKAGQVAALLVLLAAPRLLAVTIAPPELRIF